VLDCHIEVAIVVERAGVCQLELRLILAAAAILLDQCCVWEFALRIFVQTFRIRMGRRRIEIEIEVLYVLTVIALGIRETEDALLEDRVAAVPKREREAEARLAIGESQQSVLAPSVRARA